MEERYLRIYVYILCFLFSFTFLSGVALSSHTVSADVVDDVSIVVPVSCSLEGTNTEHNATIINGTYNSNVGLSTIKAYCNDSEGFSIYAIGYTDNEDGNNVLTDGTHDISTGIQTSGNDSQWAMKLAIPSSPAPTYPLTIDSDTSGSFSGYHVVPSLFTKVAHRASSTDIGVAAEGSTFTSTYQVYISNTQPAGIYSGKVKYLLIHPASKVPPIGDGTFVTIDYWGNGKLYSNNDEKNTVTYEVICDSQGANCDVKPVWGQYREPVGFNKWIAVISGGQNMEFSSEAEMIATMEYLISGGSLTLPEGNTTVAFVAENTDVLTMVAYGNEEEGMLFNNGSVTNVYSVTKTCGYSGEPNPCSDYTEMYEVVDGSYEEPSGFDGWRVQFNNSDLPIRQYDYLYTLMYVSIGQIGWENVVGEVVFLNAATSPGVVTYNGNGATLGMMSSERIAAIPGNEFVLKTPNYKKTGYGFVGWSENPNAVPGGSSRIYGPNEIVEVEDLNLQNKSTTLYAIWVASAGNLQNWNGCSSLSSGGVTALTDTRDGNAYAVAKLADGNCWMIENLRLDDTAVLSSANTNNPALPLTNIYGSTTSNQLSSSTALGNWCQTNTASCTDQSMFYNGNLAALSRSTETILDEAYGRGGYYNRYSATAGRVLASTGSTELEGGDICPIGWSLPTENDFEASANYNNYDGVVYPNNKLMSFNPDEIGYNMRGRNDKVFEYYLIFPEWDWMDGWMMNLGSVSTYRYSPGMVRCVVKTGN